MSKKLFTKVVSISLAAAMLVSMAPVDAVAATVKPKSMKLSKTSKIKVGQTKTITASRKNKKSNKDVKYVNFKPAKTKDIRISVKTSDDTVVSVEKVSETRYTYTGISAGTATLTVTSKAKTAADKKLKATLDVTVINPFKATQTGAFTFTMSTADKLEKVEKKDVQVRQEGNLVDNAVKSVKISEDKMSVEVEMEIQFVDGKKYEITFGENKDSFVASVGDVAAINIQTQTAVVNDPTEVKFTLLDAKGMDVSALYKDALKSGKVTVEVTGKTQYYNPADKKVTMWKVGDTAEVKVVFHTFKYDSKTGKEDVVEAKATITCVDKSAVTVSGIEKWTVADRVLSWDTDEMKTSLPKGQNAKIFVKMKRSDNKPLDNIKEASKFTFAGINNSALFVAADGKVTAFAEGVNYVKVTYTDGDVKYEYTLPVTVTAESKPSTMTLSKGYLALLHNAGVDETVTVKVMDQYGKDVKVTGANVKIEAISTLDVLTSSKNQTLLADGTIKFRAGTEGTSTYKVTVTMPAPGSEKFVNTITVACQKITNGVAGYDMVASANEFDITVSEATTADELKELAKGVDFTFNELTSGLLNKTMDLTNAAYKTKIYVNDAPVYDYSKGGDLNPNWAKLTVAGLNFKPVLEKTNDYLVQLTPGRYDIKVVFTVAGVEKELRSSVVVKGSAKAAEAGKSYDFKTFNTYEVAAVNVVGDLITGGLVTNKVTGANLDSEVQKANLVLIGKSEGTVSASLKETAQINLTTDDKYIIRRVALPSFKIDSDDKYVWVVTDMNKDIMVEKFQITSVEVTNATTLKVNFNMEVPQSAAAFTTNGNYEVKAENVFTSENLMDLTVSNVAVDGTDKKAVNVTVNNPQKKVRYIVKTKSDLPEATATSAEFDARPDADLTATGLVLEDDNKTLKITFSKEVELLSTSVMIAGKNGTITQDSADKKIVTVAFGDAMDAVTDATGGKLKVKVNEADDYKAKTFDGTLTVDNGTFTWTTP